MRTINRAFRLINAVLDVKDRVDEVGTGKLRGTELAGYARFGEVLRTLQKPRTDAHRFTLIKKEKKKGGKMREGEKERE